MIGTPTDTHADLIEAGAKAGKAVLCEKPVDLDSRRVERCLKVVEAGAHSLMIGFNRRFDPNLSALGSASPRARSQCRIVSILRAIPSRRRFPTSSGRVGSIAHMIRFRHGRFPARRRANRGHGLWFGAGRSGDRQGRRPSIPRSS